MSSVEQLSCEISEFEKLRQQAQLPNVRKAIDELIERWKLMLAEQNQKPEYEKTIYAQQGPKLVSSVSVRPTKKLTTYAFDESDKFVKLYYSIPGISDTAPGTISTDFREKFFIEKYWHLCSRGHLILLAYMTYISSFLIHCSNINGIDYEIRVQGLCHAIDSEKSVVKQKSGDQLLVMLKKAREHENWGSLLKLEKEVGKNKMPKMDKDSDPQESLMNMMKQMYDDGDDEMKRTIRKAWHEAQSKKSAVDMDI